MKINKKYYIKIVLLVLISALEIFAQDVNLEIENQLRSKYNLPYSITTLVNVDTAMAFSATSYYIGSKYSDNEITDPYGTLEGSYIFVAERNFNDSTSGKVVGIYKDSDIKWVSDSLLYNDMGSELHRTYDLNLDGTVEIVITWYTKTRNMRITPQTMWIFSWDGVSGYPINEIEGLHSKLESYSPFSFIDYNGNGIMELIGEKHNDETESIEKIFWVWNGSNYVSSPSLEPNYINQKNATATISCSVTKENDEYLYQYTVKNDNSSKRRIDDINIKTGDVDVINKSTEQFNWRYSGAPETVPYLTWSTSAWGYTPIKVGEIRSGYVFSSFSLPSIQTFHISSEAIGVHRVKTFIWYILNNSTIGNTIAPKQSPTPFIPTDFIDTLSSYTNSSHALGWIETEEIKTKYNTYFNNAKIFLQQTDTASAKAELQLVINECNVDSATVLTSEAYALLYFNTEYLVEQLPDTDPLPVELTMFIGEVVDTAVVLHWQTATEINNYGFSVLRYFGKLSTSLRSATENDTSTPLSASWEEIGFVEGHGNSYSPKDYSYTDTLSLSSTVAELSRSYRLKQIDTNGGYKYSKTITVIIE